MSGLFRLDGKVVAVVGAGAGIGEAVARAAAGQGARVFCLDISEPAARATAARIRQAGGTADAASTEITDAGSIDAALQDVVTAAGRLDGLVCTPGINVRKKLLDYSEDEFDRVVRVNLKGTFNALRSAGRIMAAQGAGSIVILSSIRSVAVEPGQSVYACTKAGIVQLVRGAACELGPRGVRVNAVGPGVVETALTAPIKSDPAWYSAYANKSILKRWATPDEIAGPTVFLISDAASFVTGTILFADGGWLAADGRFTPPGM
ncbi:MAG: SDR family oxidoreductase [Luteitalea sp.]|nr:SDR family oxidoreductase [Luteitalea sp.]